MCLVCLVWVFNPGLRLVVLFVLNCFGVFALILPIEFSGWFAFDYAVWICFG